MPVGAASARRALRATACSRPRNLRPLRSYRVASRKMADACAFARRRSCFRETPGKPCRRPVRCCQTPGAPARQRMPTSMAVPFRARPNINPQAFMNESNDAARELSGRLWDVIVVGTGMGGATLGHALARMGKSVLFCERGASHLDSAEAITGEYPEQRSGRAAFARDTDATELLRRGGRYTGMVSDESKARRVDFVPFIGSGTVQQVRSTAWRWSGSSRSISCRERVMRLRRARRSEAAWPLTYEQLAPYYTAAEALYRVRGGVDPLRAEAGRAAVGPSRHACSRTPGRRAVSPSTRPRTASLPPAVGL